MRIHTITVTEQGRQRALPLPYPASHGQAGPTIRALWAEVDGFVVFLATGATVRIVGPLLASKQGDPAVVCVDEAGRFAVALCGGHAGGANQLAREVASLIGAEPVITTATDGIGLMGLDTIGGMVAHGDVATVTKARLDGLLLRIDNPRGWPLPPGWLTPPAPDGAPGAEPGAPVPWASAAGGPPPAEPVDVVVMVTDQRLDARRSQVVLHPPSLVIGAGASSGASTEELAGLVSDVLSDAGLAPESVAEVATIDIKGQEPAILALGFPVRTFPAVVLAGVDVPTPSETVRRAVGTASVAEAAALLAAGPGGELLVAKRARTTVTIAVARRRQPRGHLAVVGLGPGLPAHRTPAAAAAVRSADVVVGYGPYIDLCADVIAPGAEVVRSPIGAETTRVKQALVEAAGGRRTALVCSGDAGVYAMASLVFELSPEEPGLDPVTDVDVIPGVTAALAASAVLGAPLGHDHVAISLSDLLTPWWVIERRLLAAAESDLVVSLYNPRSAGRSWQLEAARRILGAHRLPSTPVGVVSDAGRSGQTVAVTTLEGLDVNTVAMTTCVIVGSSTTRVIGGRMMTPRGYL